MTTERDADMSEVDLALADLAIAAVKRLQVEMGTARNSRDRIAAANSILDRVGYSRTPRAQAEVADQEIRRALQAAASHGVSTEVAGMLEGMQDEEREHWLKEQASAEKKTRAEEQQQDEARYLEQKRAEDERHEAAWEAAEPGEPITIDAADIRQALAAENPGGEILDFTQDRSEQGPDDEETDAWLDA